MTIFWKSTAFALAFAGALSVTTVDAQSADPVAKVNGKAIPQSRMDLVMKMNAGQGQQDTPEARSRVRDMLINQELIVQEALKKGLDKNADVATQIDLSRQQVLINAYIQDYLKTNTVSEDSMKKEYDHAKAQAGDKEYKARHILVKTEDEAKQVIAQLKKGANFEKLAAQKSEDTGSKERGGDLDWAPPGRYVPAFGEALKKLKKGQLTDAPVQTQFGWHVIRLDDERPAKFPSFEESKQQIQQGMQRQAIDKAVADLRAKAKIE
jgi:peptidyl-prolyl cis-trans isomerase C